jgi:hypothetical protein
MMINSSARPLAATCVSLGLLAGVLALPAHASGSSQLSSRSAYTLTHISTISSGDGEGGAEISAYDASTKSLVATNAVDFTLDIYDLTNPESPVKRSAVSLASYGSTVTSVATKDGIAVVAVPGATTFDANTGIATIATGKVVIVDVATGTILDDAQVGYLPDGVAIAPNGLTAVVANEAEPKCALDVVATASTNESTDPSLISDPVGTVTLVDLTNPSAVTTREVNFTNFTRANAIARGLIVRSGATPAQDFEPEFVAIAPDSRTAYITLQENNGMAVIDLSSGTIRKLSSLGAIDRSVVPLDPSDRDSAKSPTQKFDHVFSLRMPDAIAAYSTGNQTFVVSADEGDARDEAWPCITDDVRAKNLNADATAFPTWAAVKADAALGRAKANPNIGDPDGDGDYDAIYLRGGRTLSVYDNLGNVIADTGAQIEQWFSDYNLSGFNGQYVTTNSVTTYVADDRSDDKGAEPEGVAVGSLGDKKLAFVGLERANALAIIDVTNPAKPTLDDIAVFDNYALNGAASDLTRWSPEGVIFVPASDSPTGKSLVITSFEMSGSISIDELDAKPSTAAVTTSQSERSLKVAFTSPTTNGKRTYSVNLVSAYKNKKATIRVMRSSRVVKTLGTTKLNDKGNARVASTFALREGDIVQVLTDGRIRASLTVQ